MKAQATSPILEAVGSHHIGYGRAVKDGTYGHVPITEECFPVLSVIWRKQTLRVQLHARRYESTAGWGSWHIFTTRALESTPGMPGSGPALSDTARAAINDACVPVVEKWLESAEYANSRRQAFAHAIKRDLQDTRSSYDLNPIDETLMRDAHELKPEDLERFKEALAALGHFYELIND